MYVGTLKENDQKVAVKVQHRGLCDAVEIDFLVLDFLVTGLNLINFSCSKN